MVNDSGRTVRDRFHPPPGFRRIEAARGSFAEYLQRLPLKPPGAPVKYYNGAEKPGDAYLAVIDMEISPKNLQQCADAVMRLRAEYLYSRGHYDSIVFRLTNGFITPYSRWMKGERVKVSGNHCEWRSTAKPSGDHAEFRKYLDFIFTYAGTLSLAREMKPARPDKMQIGDVFIQGGSPGHAVIVVDMAVNPKGEKVFMLAQSYMPAQETQVLKNPADRATSPWYFLNGDPALETPEWNFRKSDLKTW